MYRKELPVGDRVTEEPSSADDIGDQLSEYDSDSSKEEDSATHQEDAVEAVPVNFLSKTMRTCTGRQISLSYRALSSYWGTKSYFFLQKPLKTRVNSKYQSKGSTYILHLLAFVEIRLFNVFLWERKAGFGKLMKNVRDAGFSRKRGGNAGSGPPLPDPRLSMPWWQSYSRFPVMMNGIPSYLILDWEVTDWGSQNTLTVHLSLPLPKPLL